MPPHSTSIHEEGAVFKSFKLVEGGVFQEKGKKSFEWFWHNFDLQVLLLTSDERGSVQNFFQVLLCQKIL